MTKIIEYSELVVLIYSSGRSPLRIHGKYKDHESAAEWMTADDGSLELVFGSVKGKPPLPAVQFAEFETLMKNYSKNHVECWNNYLRVTQQDEVEIDSQTPALELPKDAVIEIVAAEYVDGFRLRLIFSDGVERVVDFQPFLRRARNPMISIYHDLAKFQQFSIIDGDLSWNDFDLCFAIADLYEGRIG